MANMGTASTARASSHELCAYIFRMRSCQPVYRRPENEACAAVPEAGGRWRSLSVVTEEMGTGDERQLAWQPP